MLNVCSPTVQAMLANTPQGFGNMPMYFGNAPTVTTTDIADPNIQQGDANGFRTPFPSPKEMLMQGGQTMVYQPTYFAPPPQQFGYVGGYNPGFNAAFANYSNPYMGYGTYSGYGMMMQLDPQEKIVNDVAIENDLTYGEQLEIESELYKTISRIVSLNLKRPEELAKKCEERFTPYPKNQTVTNPSQTMFENKAITVLNVRIEVGDEIIADSKIGESNPVYINNQAVAQGVERAKARNDYVAAEKERIKTQMYMSAPERKYDKTDMFEYFRDGFGVVAAIQLSRDLYEQSMRRTGQVYNKDDFRKRLLEANGIKSKEQKRALSRYVGRYGIMPDGRPVSPGHDPSIASSFSYDPNTGQYHVTPPDFIAKRYERAREMFIKQAFSNEDGG